MTANRLELLRHVHRTSPRSTLSLSKALDRDYKRVHENVEALVAAAPLDRDATGYNPAQPATGAIAPSRTSARTQRSITSSPNAAGNTATVEGAPLHATAATARHPRMAPISHPTSVTRWN
jgi:hypothetical protein